MKRFLRNFPLHTFLVGIYVISVVYVRNMDKVFFSSTLRSIGLSLLLSLIIFGVLALIYRAPRKAGVFATIVLAGIFFYGLIYEQLEILFYKGLWPFSHIHRFLIGAYFIIYLSLFIYFFRSKKPYYRGNYILNVMLLFLFVINIISGLASKKETVTDFENPLISKTGSIGRKATAADPDVYYIVLDGYASEDVLKKYYGPNATGLYDHLRSRGFFIADSSKANYPVTAESLASSLNMTYLDTLKAGSSYGLVQKNLVAHLFRQQGYRVRNVESGYSITNHIEDADETVTIPSLNEFENRLVDLTILRLDDLVGTRYYNRLTSQLNILEEVKPLGGQPTFNFIHIVAPHPPYVLDSSGNRKVRTALSDLAWEPRELYVDQMIHVNRKITAFIDRIVSSSRNQPLIILQSDHGPWLTETKESLYHARMSILNAYLVPDAVKERLTRSITPVNTFRVVFSGLFQSSFDTLPFKKYPLEELEKHPVFNTYSTN